LIGIVYLLLFITGGIFIARFWLPGRRAVVRWYLGAAIGVLLTMWLPALWAYAVNFSLPAHGLAAGTLCLLVLGAYFTRDKAAPLKFSGQDKKNIKLLLILALPLTILAGYLSYTHSIRLAADGTYHVGQSTYGDLSLHLAIATSAVNASFPLQNSLLLGSALAYPYLSDTIATSMLMMGMGLPAAMAFTGTLFCAMAFSGYVLLATELCRKRGAAALAALLLFLNGGLGFFYTLSGTVEDGVTTTLWDNLRTVMTGYYKTPTNQPDPYNLRWVNIICDMLIPQRSFAGGWAMLMPIFLLILPPITKKRRITAPHPDEKPMGCSKGRDPSNDNPKSATCAVTSEALQGKASLRQRLAVSAQSAGTSLWRKLGKATLALFRNTNAPRAFVLAGVMAGGMPLLHTHSFLALGLASIGFCGYAVVEAKKGERFKAFKPFLWFGGIAVLLAAPQLFSLTFVQATGSDHFLRFQFNWCNNRGGNGLVEPYFWFYIKNIGIPYILIILALFQSKRKAPGSVRQYRLIAVGAFLILLVAEFIVFQPNEYDNNKLIYVWFLLLLPMATDYLVTLYEKLRGVGGRRILAVLVLIACFLSAGLTVARECVSDYQAYTAEDIEAAEYIRENTPEHCVFITGTQHLNPAASLAGRTIYCGASLYLYYHGYSTTDRQAALKLFYENPAENLTLLNENGVSYVYVSSWERSSYAVDEATLDSLFDRVYESGSGSTVIWAVGDTDQ